jgi:vacuolar-type H+-ATPase subunit H
MGCDGGMSMDEEKSILQQIRDKEQELNTEIESVKLQCEEKVSAAMKEAVEIMRTAENSAKTAAEDYYRQEKKTTDAEIDRLKKESAELLASAQEKGRQNFAAAVRKITADITLIE